MNLSTLGGALLAITAVFFNVYTIASKHKCLATITSDALGDWWEPSNVKWKSPKHQTNGTVEATIHGRLNIPTGEGSTIRGHVCYATLSVNLANCTIVFASDVQPEDGWQPHQSPIYRNHDSWKWNQTIEFRPDCPENVHVEVFEP